METGAHQAALALPTEPAMPTPTPPPDALRQELDALSDALARPAPGRPSPDPARVPPDISDSPDASPAAPLPQRPPDTQGTP